SSFESAVIRQGAHFIRGADNIGLVSLAKFCHSQCLVCTDYNRGLCVFQGHPRIRSSALSPKRAKKRLAVPLPAPTTRMVAVSSQSWSLQVRDKPRAR